MTTARAPNMLRFVEKQAAAPTPAAVKVGAFVDGLLLVPAMGGRSVTSSRSRSPAPTSTRSAPVRSSACSSSATGT